MVKGRRRRRGSGKRNGRKGKYLPSLFAISSPLSPSSPLVLFETFLAPTYSVFEDAAMVGGGFNRIVSFCGCDQKNL